MYFEITFYRETVNDQAYKSLYYCERQIFLNSDAVEKRCCINFVLPNKAAPKEITIQPSAQKWCTSVIETTLRIGEHGMYLACGCMTQTSTAPYRKQGVLVITNDSLSPSVFALHCSDSVTIYKQMH